MRKILAVLALPLLAACSSGQGGQNLTPIAQLKPSAISTVEGTVKAVSPHHTRFILQDATGKIRVVTIGTQQPVVKVRKGDIVAADGSLGIKGSFEATHVTVVKPAPKVKKVKAAAKTAAKPAAEAKKPVLMK